MRTRSPQQIGRPLSEAERLQLRCLLGAIPLGADCHDERVVAFVDLWNRLHLRPYAGGYSIYNLRCTRRASAELLAGLQAALDGPNLSGAVRPECTCDRCLMLRGEAILRQE